MASEASPVTESTWTGAFRERTDASFAAGLAEGVELHASVARRPIVGRDAVAYTLQEASRMYAALEFVSQAGVDNRTFLEWTARTHTGLDLAGVTILDRDADGLIERIAIHHRPLDGLLGFSAELGRRTGGLIDPSLWIGS